MKTAGNYFIDNEKIQFNGDIVRNSMKYFFFSELLEICI